MTFRPHGEPLRQHRHRKEWINITMSEKGKPLAPGERVCLAVSKLPKHRIGRRKLAEVFLISHRAAGPSEGERKSRRRGNGDPASAVPAVPTVGERVVIELTPELIAQI